MPSVTVPALSGDVLLDGRLTEPCYKSPPLVANFVVPGNPALRPQPTRAWLFWQPDRFIFAFDVEDAAIVSSPPSTNKHDLDTQDRVELYLWSGSPRDAYYCVEIAAGGALHDYKARFYRQFDDSWNLPGFKYAVAPTPRGYSVEAAIPRAAMEQMGFHLRAGETMRAGLFRADYSPAAPGQPTWICWVDGKTPQPDFHVAASFGKIILGQ
jgi:hypothetical protein